MKRVCAWCKKDLPFISAVDVAGEGITHGICTDCANVLTAKSKSRIRDLLDTLEAPVFLVDGEGRINSANLAAQDILGKSESDIEDQLGGDVFECANARLPGGCGQSIHCKGCTVRNTVMKTLATGRSAIRIPAYQNIITDEGPTRMLFQISTQKAGAGVLLRIDNIEEADAE